MNAPLRHRSGGGTRGKGSGAVDGAMPARVRRLRSAVYTRKSSEEGLDMAFNSLDAQREACEAYVASQRQEGWTLVPDYYDDGGFSGGTLERPALRRLVEDIEAGKVDVVVVYKIDRLSRSLMDFARLVDVFDRKGVTFVSVTQSFNTTTSMGRLMPVVRALARAFRWRKLIETGEFATVRGIAEAEGVNASYVSRVLRLTLLMPRIVERLIEGREAERDATGEALLEPFPTNWQEQMRAFSRFVA